MKVDFSNDINLIRSLKKGDQKGYGFLVKLYHKNLCVYACSLNNDSDLSEDIVQNVFMSIWKNRYKLKDDFSVKSYLYNPLCILNNTNFNIIDISIKYKFIDILNCS